MRSRARWFIVSLLAVALALWAEPASAAEPFPADGFDGAEAPADVRSEAEAQIAAYEASSKMALDKLTAMLRSDKEFRSSDWLAVANGPANLRNIARVRYDACFPKGAGANNSANRKGSGWWDQEDKAWAGIRAIAADIAWAHMWAEREVDGTREDLAAWPQRRSRLQAIAKKADIPIEFAIEALAAGADGFGELQKIAAYLKQIRDQQRDLDGSYDPATKAVQLYETFVEEAKRRAAQLTASTRKVDQAISKIDSVKIDPDGSGTYARYEQDWSKILGDDHKALLRWKEDYLEGIEPLTDGSMLQGTAIASRGHDFDTMTILISDLKTDLREVEEQLEATRAKLQQEQRERERREAEDDD